MSSESNYGPLIEGMRWSYSRIKTFEECPYQWYLRYICKFQPDNRFYASYGTFMHKLLADYYSGKCDKSELILKYYKEFATEVDGYRPKDSILNKYIQTGADYFNSFEPFPYKTVAVEDTIEFDLEGIPFVAVVDYLGEQDGEFYLIDHKSRMLKPRSGHRKPTKSDLELDDMLKQLYIYCYAVKEKYGKYPSYIGFNCFRCKTLIIEPVEKKAFAKAIHWATESIAKIREATEFPANENGFSCFWICGMTRLCEPYQQAVEERMARKLAGRGVDEGGQ